MRSIVIIFFYISFLLVNSVFSQEVEVTLSGSTISQGLSIKNSLGNTLFRVRGDGTTGLGTSTPIGFFDVFGGAVINANAKDINIIGQDVDNTSTPGFKAGDVNIKAGKYYNFGGSINIETQSPGSSDNPGHINIRTANDGIGSGGINMITGSTDGVSGNVRIETGFADASSGNIELIAGVCGDGCGDIILYAGNQYAGYTLNDPGRVVIKAGNSIDGLVAGDIEMKAGSSDESGGNGGDVTISAGNSNPMNATGNGGNVIVSAGNTETDNGGNIVLDPGDGPGINGIVSIIGSGIYSGTWTQSSDERFKKNIQPLKNSVNKIELLKGVSYEMKTEEYPEKNFSIEKQIGLIAQDVEKVFPELVVTDSEGYKSVAYQNLVAVLIEAVKEQQKSINQLKKEVELLKSSADKNNIEISSLGN